MSEQKQKELVFIKQRIDKLQKHGFKNKHDSSSKVALSKQVGAYKKLKKYLKRLEVKHAKQNHATAV